jgi:hypothetical protein
MGKAGSYTIALQVSPIRPSIPQNAERENIAVMLLISRSIDSKSKADLSAALLIKIVA